MSREKKLEAKLQISGELEASLKQAIKAAEQNMDKFATAAEKAEGATAALSKTIKSQERQLKAAQKMYQSYALTGDTTSQEARDLAAAIDDLTWDLENNKAAMAKAEDAARDLASRYDSIEGSTSRASAGLHDTESAADQADGGFTVLKGTLANLAADGFQRLISGAGQAVGALMQLSEQTREFRQDVASLETAYDQHNFSAEQATSTARSLYGVFGETDRAVEAANNIARMSSSQEELNNWLQISTGAWAVFQDALPVENLAEAAGETAQTGTVVGGLADALNWSSEAAEMFSEYMGGDVVTAEDAFNKALSECTTEQERQQLIMDTLMALYGDAGEQYKLVNGELIAMNESTWDATVAQANLGDIMDPVNTKVNELKSSLMERLAPALETVADKAVDALTWLQEHPGVMQAIITAAGILAGVITVAATAMIAVGVASAIASAGMLPIIAVAALVAAAIGILVFIALNLGNIWDWLKGVATSLADWLAAKWEFIKTTVYNAAQAVVTFIQSIWGGLVGIVKSIWDGIVSTLSDIWDTIKSKAKAMIDSVVDMFSSGWGALTGILSAPFNAVTGLIDTVGSKLSGLISKAKSVGSSIVSKLPGFATGGFTNGPSIAGEAGTEAVISFDPAYRSENLRYWARAGQMLGVEEVSPLSMVSGSTSTSNSTVIESVNFAPNITITGNADKQDIIAAIRETYPEFMDLIDEVLADREVGAYA